MKRFLGSVVLILLVSVIAVFGADRSGASLGWTSFVGLATLILASLIALRGKSRMAAIQIIVVATVGIGGFYAARTNPPFAWEGRIVGSVEKAQEMLESKLSSGKDLGNRMLDAWKNLFAAQPKAPVAVTAAPAVAPAPAPASSEEQLQAILKRLDLLESQKRETDKR